LTSCLLSRLEKKCTEDAIAIAHDDDLQLVENVVRPKLMFGATNNVRAQEARTADAVERVLHENEVAVLVEDGGTMSYAIPSRRCSS
jgi:hypothetical protein